MRKVIKVTGTAFLTMGLATASLARTVAPAPAEEDHGAHHPEGPRTPPAPEQMQRRIAFLTARIEAMRAVSAAAAPFHAVLSAEQRRTADELMAENVRGMRTGMM